MLDCKLQTTFRLILENGSEGVGKCSFCRTHFCTQIWAVVIKSLLGKLRASGFLVYCQGSLYLDKMLLLLLPLWKFHHKRWWCKLLYRITDTPLLTLIATKLQKLGGKSREQWSKGRIWSRLPSLKSLLLQVPTVSESSRLLSWMSICRLVPLFAYTSLFQRNLAKKHMGGKHWIFCLDWSNAICRVHPSAYWLDLIK